MSQFTMFIFVVVLFVVLFKRNHCRQYHPIQILFDTIAVNNNASHMIIINTQRNNSKIKWNKKIPTVRHFEQYILLAHITYEYHLKQLIAFILQPLNFFKLCVPQQFAGRSNIITECYWVFINFLHTHRVINCVIKR